ncbi:hypothetical protein BVI434_920006 [Burkholderia vietnamiensis]|nr:hypothetical protein BVI434_920006 [Burkholderia vietnamiensis]
MRPDRHRRAARHDRRDPRAARRDRRAREQRGERCAPRDRRRDARVVRRRHRGEPASPVLRRASRDRRHEASGRRRDHQSRLDQLDAEERRLPRLRDGEGGRAGPHARPRARSRAVRDPREFAGARLGDDRQAAQAVARRRGPRGDQGRSVHRRRIAAGRSRAHGAVSRGRRQPDDHRAGRGGRRRLGLIATPRSHGAARARRIVSSTKERSST